MSDAAKPPATRDAEAFAAARPAGQTGAPSTPKLRRDQPSKKLEQARRLVPAASAFDLLDGEYARTRKSRIVSLVSLGAAGLMVVLFTAQLLRIRFEIASEKNRYREATTAGTESKVALDQLSQFEGVPGDVVSGALTGRSVHAAAATEAELDLVQIVNELTSMVPPGITITNISLDPAAREESKKESSEEGKAADPSDLRAVITVLADADSYPVISPFLERMRASENLSDFKESWSGEPPLLRVRVDINVRVASSARYIQFATDAGIIEMLTPEEGSTEEGN